MARAKPRLLQTVDLTDLNMSTQGGYARLYSLSDHALCRMEVGLYGERGKVIYDFTFGSRLRDARVKEYEYEAPIYDDPDTKETLVSTTTLKDSHRMSALSKKFMEYK